MSLSITASLGSKVGQYMRGNSQEPKPGPIHESGTIHERPIHERALYLNKRFESKNVPKVKNQMRGF